MALEAGEIEFIRRQTAAGGNNSFVAPFQFFDDAVFPFAECWLAMVLEDFLNRCARSGLDDIVRIQKGKMQSVSCEPPHRRFSGPHKTDQREIPDLAGAVHSLGLGDFARKGTWFLRPYGLGKVPVPSRFAPYSTDNGANKSNHRLSVLRYLRISQHGPHVELMVGGGKQWTLHGASGASGSSELPSLEVTLSLSEFYLNVSLLDEK